jgi:micrococcal nuclease
MGNRGVYMQWLVTLALLGMGHLASAEDLEQGSSQDSSQSSNPEILGAACKHNSKAFHCVRFLHNYDGDTFTVNISSVHPLLGDKITVRVLGVDAPEIAADDACERAAALKAQQMVEKALGNARRIDLVDIQRDKYFRVLADVEVDGKSLAKMLLKENLGVEYDGGHKEHVNWCRR